MSRIKVTVEIELETTDPKLDNVVFGRIPGEVTHALGFSMSGLPNGVRQGSVKTKIVSREIDGKKI